MSRNKSPAKQHHNTPSVQQIKAASFSGPLPPPDILSGYDDICPGAAERIIKTYENEVAHRHELERAAVEAEIKIQSSIPREILIGQIFAFVVCIGFLAAGTFLISTEHEISGSLFGGGGLVGVVSAFLVSRKHANNNHQN